MHSLFRHGISYYLCENRVTAMMPGGAERCHWRSARSRRDPLWAIEKMRKSRSALPANTADFDKGLALLKQPKSPRQRPLQDFSEAGIRRVAARYPQELRGRAKAFEEVEEVAILRNHNRERSARGLVYLPVFGIAQTQVAHGAHLNRETSGNPRCQIG